MVIKPKSIVVAILSSFIIALALTLTIVGYVFYLEIKADEFRRAYHNDLYRIQARLYGSSITHPALIAKIEAEGPLRRKPVLEGCIKNIGGRNIYDLIVKAKFLDRDGAIIYEVDFRPWEPSLGAQAVYQVPLTHMLVPRKPILAAGGSLSFKKILTGCPVEIYNALRDREKLVSNAGAWPGSIELELIRVEF